jgi:hypothetical protein
MFFSDKINKVVNNALSMLEDIHRWMGEWKEQQVLPSQVERLPKYVEIRSVHDEYTTNQRIAVAWTATGLDVFKDGQRINTTDSPTMVVAQFGPPRLL